ncbi:MAG TPA: outer membrane protein transport protein [Gemmatimonadales bacterium]|nr:outer membrane protein transport protein [Gemmatimonadales bacterium]
MRRLALLLFAGVPSLVQAQGFSVYEHNTCAMARGGAAVASPCADGSALWFNPAGLAGLSGTHLSAGGTLIHPFGNFTDDYTATQTDMPDQNYLVPNLFITHAVTSKFGVGFGIFAPYGLGTKWPTTFLGRFAGYNTSIKTIYFQPTIAYQITPKLSVGGALAYVHSSLELHQRVDLSAQPLPPALDGALGLPVGTLFSALGIQTGTDAADAVLTATGNTITAHFGVLYKATSALTLGLRYLMGRTISYSGSANFTELPTGDTLAAGATPLNPSTPLPVDLLVATQFLPDSAFANGTATTHVRMPAQVVLGAAYTVTPKWSVMSDVQYTRWRDFSTLNINFANPATPDRHVIEGYKDTWALRLGTEYQWRPKVTVRAGYLTHSAAAPAQTVTPLLPEGPRNEFTIGIGTPITPALHLDLAYQYIRQQSRRGRVTEPASGPPTTAMNSGLYNFKAHLFGLGVAYTF